MHNSWKSFTHSYPNYYMNVQYNMNCKYEYTLKLIYTIWNHCSDVARRKNTWPLRLAEWFLTNNKIGKIWLQLCYNLTLWTLLYANYSQNIVVFPLVSMCISYSKINNIWFVTIPYESPTLFTKRRCPWLRCSSVMQY